MFQRNLEFAHVSSLADAQLLVNQGYYPLKCDFGGEGSVIDHNLGFPSNANGIAASAYTKAYGALQNCPRFVCTGRVDADTCLAALLLSGGPKLSPGSSFAVKHNIARLVELVSKVDVDPIGIHLEEEEPWGSAILYWNQSAPHIPDASSFYAGVSNWRQLILILNRYKLFCLAVQECQRAYVAKVRAAKCERISPVVIATESVDWGFDIWHETAGVVVLLDPSDGCVTIGVRDEGRAKTYFGEAGLESIIPFLLPGRSINWLQFAPTVWSSQPPVKLTWNDALEIAHWIAAPKLAR